MRRMRRTTATAVALLLCLGGIASSCAAPEGAGATLSTGIGARSQATGAQAFNPTLSSCGGDFTVPYYPPDWTNRFVDVCLTPDREHVWVSNTSSFLVTVTSRDTATTLGAVSVADAESFGDLVTESLASTLSAAGPYRRVLPPGGSVVAAAPSGQAASVFLGLKFRASTGAWVTDKLTGYVQARFTSPGRKLAAKVADCAQEVSTTWSNLGQVDPQTDLSLLLADTALGTGVTCYPLVRELAADSNEAVPDRWTLSRELRGFGTHLRASVWDEFFSFLRRGIRVSPWG